MTLTLTIDDPTEATRLLNDFCTQTGWTVGSGVSKADWARDKLGDYLKLMAKRGEFKEVQGTIIAAIDAIVIH